MSCDLLQRLEEDWDSERQDGVLETPFGVIQTEPLANKVVRLEVRSSIDDVDFTWQIHLPYDTDTRFVEHTATVFRRQAKGWILDRNYLRGIVEQSCPDSLDVHPLTPDEVLDRCWESSMVRQTSPIIRVDFQPFGFADVSFLPKREHAYDTSTYGAELNLLDENEIQMFVGEDCVAQAIDALEGHLVKFEGCLKEFANRLERGSHD